MDILNTPIFIFILSIIVAGIGAYIKSISSKVDTMITEQNVRSLIADKLAVVDANNEATKTRIERVEESLVRIEDKLDSLVELLARKRK
jgi:hypothetical protein